MLNIEQAQSRLRDREATDRARRTARIKPDSIAVDISVVIAFGYLCFIFLQAVG